MITKISISRQIKCVYISCSFQIWDSVTEETPAPGCLKGKIDISIPMEGNLTEYVYIFKQKGAWKHWPDLVRRQEPEISSLGIQVSTIDTGRYMHLLQLHIKVCNEIKIVDYSFLQLTKKE